MLFKGRNNAIKFVDDYGLMILEAKGKAAEEPTKGKGLNVVTLKQMLQRLPIALAHVKAGNTSENLLDEIRQMIYSLHLSKKKKKKKVYKNIMNSIKVWYKKWKLYLWILKIVKHLILTYYHAILWIK